MVISELPLVILIAGVTLVGLYLSNVVYDYGTPQYLSRKIGHGVGGVGYLLCALMFSTCWYPIILSGGFTLLLGGARVIKPNVFRGVGRPTALSEVLFPLSGTIALAIGWAIFNEPLLSVACILMMAWGDAVTGIVRSKVYGKAVKGWWGSLAMFISCVIIGWALIEPFLLALMVAIGATLTEWACGDVSKIKFLRPIDDNLSIPLVSLVIALGGLHAGLG